ncbi:hypothetical protein JCM1393_19560 [Clostridium carnis]
MKIKKLSKIILILLVVLIITSPFYIWYFKSSSNIKALIIDKTVPTNDYREHKNIMWILNNKKIINEYTNDSFDFKKDYYGFFPYKLNEEEKENFHIKELPKELDSDLDLIYISDTYGVHSSDYEIDELNYKNLSYGGITLDELNSIDKVKKGKTIIGEFNIFNSPTGKEEREKATDLFGVEWTGWRARYFKDLSLNVGEVPSWIINAYENQYNEKWDKIGTGIIYVNEDGTVFVLEDKKHLNLNYVTVNFTDNAEKEYKVKSNIKYYYWYEIVKPKDKTEVLGNFNIDVTDEGKEVLEKYNLDSEYPAFIKTSSDYTTYYIACDAADNNKIMKNYKIEYYAKLMNKLSLDNSISNRNFYWKCFYPFFNKVLEDINMK